MYRRLAPISSRTKQEGFTLIEVIVAIAVLAIIITPLTIAFITMLKQSVGIDDNIRRSADAQRIGAAWTRDVQNVDPGGVNSSGSCPSTSSTAVPEAVLVTFSWDSAVSADTVVKKASWVAVDLGESMQLVRRYCEDDAPVIEQVLADRIGVAGSSAIEVVHGPDDSTPEKAQDFCPAVNKGSSASPRMVSEACTIEVDGSFSYHLTVTRRVPDRDPASVTPTVPPPPTITALTGRNEYLTVTWNPPPIWQPPVDGYRVFASLSPDGSPVASVTVDGTSNAGDVTGLTNYTDYWVRVQSHNSLGWGQLSPATGPVQPHPTAPDAPTNIVAVAGDVNSPTTATITWDLPANNGGSAIDEMRVTARAQDGSLLTPVTLSGAVTSASYPGLSPGERYVFVVDAHNSVGYGLTGESNQITTLPPQPTSVVATGGDARLHVTFTLAGNGPVPLAGSGAVRVTATCVSGAGCVDQQWVHDHPSPGSPNGTWGPFSSTSGSPAPTIVNGATYSVRVEVKNNLGDWGPISAAVTATAARVPDAPSFLSINANNSSNSLDFSLPAPYDGGSPVTNFRVTNLNADEWISVPFSGGTTGFVWDSSTPTFTGSLSSPTPAGTAPLTDFVVQNFKFEACSALGCSAQSPTFGAAPGPIPVATSFQAVQGGGAGQVTASNFQSTAGTTGSASTFWTVTCPSPSNPASGPLDNGASSVTVSGVPAGTHTCTARPTNRLVSTSFGAPSVRDQAGDTVSVSGIVVYGTPGTFTAEIDLPATGVVNNVSVRATTPPSSGGGTITYTSSCTSTGGGSGSGGPTATNGVPVAGPLSQGTVATCTLTATNSGGFSRTATVTRRLQRNAPVITQIRGQKNVTVQDSGGNSTSAHRVRQLVAVRVDPGIDVTGMRWTLQGTTTSGAYVTSNWSIYKAVHDAGSVATSTFKYIYVWVEPNSGNGNWLGIGSTRAIPKNAAFSARVTDDQTTPDQAITYWATAEWQSSGDEDYPTVFATSTTNGATLNVGQTFTIQYQCDDNDGGGEDYCDSARIRLRRLGDGAETIITLNCLSKVSGDGCETRDGPTDNIFNADDNTSRTYGMAVPSGTTTGRWAIEWQGCNEGGSCPAYPPSGYAPDNNWQMLGFFDVP